MYSLSGDEPKEQVARCKKELTAQLRVAIRDCLAAVAEQAGHFENPSTYERSVYFQPGEPLATYRRPSRPDLTYTYPNAPLLYLRVIPSAQEHDLKESVISDLISGIKIAPLRLGFGASHCRNAYGGVTFSSEKEQDKGSLLTSTQLFRNRELWGIDATLLAGERQIPSHALEDILRTGLLHYLEFGKKYLDYDGPLWIEAGATGVRDYYMEMGDRYFPRAWGPITVNTVFLRKKLEGMTEEWIDSVLLAIFEKMLILLLNHPSVSSVRLNLGTRRGWDIESEDDEGIVAEVFAATSPRSNDKLKKD